MEKYAVGDLEIAILETCEFKELTSNLIQHREERFEAVKKSLSETFGELREVEKFYGVNFDSPGFLRIMNPEEGFQVILARLKKVREIDPDYHRHPFTQAVIYMSIAHMNSSIIEKKKRAGRRIYRGEAVAVCSNFYFAAEYAKEAVSLYKKASDDWPDLKEGYEGTLQSMITNATCQGPWLMARLQGNETSYPELTAQTHRLFRELFKESVFPTRKESLKALGSYAYAIMLGSQEDQHFARGYLQAVQEGLGPLSVITHGLSFLNQRLQEKIC